MKLNKTNKTNGKVKTVRFKEIKDKKKGAIMKNKDKIIEFLKLGGIVGIDAIGFKIIETVFKTSKAGIAIKTIYGIAIAVTEMVQVNKIAKMILDDKNNKNKSEDELWAEANDDVTIIIRNIKNLQADDKSKMLEMFTEKLSEELSEEELCALADFIKNAKKGGDEDDDTIIDLD